MGGTRLLSLNVRRKMMKRSSIVIIALAVALIVTNVLWAYRVLDLGVSRTYHEVSFGDHREALAQALAIIPVAVRPGATRTEILEVARRKAQHRDSFEKEGFVWVGRLGLKFEGNGRLVEVVPAWSPF